MELLKKIRLVIFYGFLILLLLYMAGYVALRATDLSYQFWVTRFMIVIGLLAVMILLGLSLVIFLADKKPNKPTWKYLLYVLPMAAFLVLLGTVSFYQVFFGYHLKEKKMAAGYYEEYRHQHIFYSGEERHEYFEPVTGFFKREIAIDDPYWVLKELEDKYEKAFGTKMEEDQVLYYAEDMPEVLFEATLENDNFFSLYRNEIIRRAFITVLGEEPEYTQKSLYSYWNGQDHYLEEPVYVCGKADNKASFKEDARKIHSIVKTASEHDFFYDNLGAVTYVFSGDEELDSYLISFGNLQYRNPEDWDEQFIYEQIVAAAERLTSEKHKQEEEAEAEEKRKEEEAAALAAGKEEEEAAYQAQLEELYRPVYEAVFEPMGEELTFEYTAKGSHYLELKDGRSLFYDRESKNGKCNLFVYYGGGHDWETMKILNFYAVVKETGEVIAADKTSWEEVGCAEYREATGE